MKSSLAAVFSLLAILFLLPATAQEDAPKDAKPAEEEEIYIPKDLDDAVRELNKLIRPEDKELIKTGEIDSVDMHFGLGMGLRNAWGLWGGSRLAVHFREQGITHPDNMSGYILDAFCRNLRGQKHDLLSIMRENAKKRPAYHKRIADDGNAEEGRTQAILFRKFDYDEKKRVVSTSLLWNPKDGKIYLEERSKSRLATEQEVKQFREANEGWNFTPEEERVLANLRSATPQERLATIKGMNEEDRWKFDGLLPRARDPEGLDKVPDDPFGDDQPATAPEAKLEGDSKPQPESEEGSQ